VAKKREEKGKKQTIAKKVQIMHRHQIEILQFLYLILGKSFFWGGGGGGKKKGFFGKPWSF